GGGGGPAVTLTLFWKEWREHRHVWLLMAALGAVLLVGLSLVLPTESGNAETPLVVAALVLAVTYGLVCGAMMLAGEHECGTLAFLDTLPALRLRLWGGKAL